MDKIDVPIRKLNSVVEIANVFAGNDVNDAVFVARSVNKDSFAPLIVFGVKDTTTSSEFRLHGFGSHIYDYYYYSASIQDLIDAKVPNFWDKPVKVKSKVEPKKKRWWVF